MDSFSHIRVIISMILGFGVAQLLKNLVKLIDHPKKSKSVYWLHLGWVFYIFILIVLFWWWEYRLEAIQHWNFLSYLFLIIYTTLYYVLCVLIFPDNVNEYKNYKDYFFSRKNWFFLFQIFLFVIDFGDSLLKGKAYFQSLHWTYPVRNILHIALCFLGIKSSNEKIQAGLFFILLVFDVLFIAQNYLY
ncbi:hypothetical protein [Chryseobacterium geocarposphaerae]|uniref:Uncharacterized protein n=1 Tax=Chryseobacterium geocarposphaerae TaxID=1416776 RepID=A0A2M9C6H7_9FLAO|nr:hypothetical protein [Chryseobacterium geocarposphaerae]PJJ66440.1 hypothetical protein CLV73_0424 [Chryseobacterium geocarposphaerae]